MRSRILLVAIVLASSACMMTVAQQAPVHDVIGPANQPMNLALTLKNGRRVNLWNATIVGDSVVGSSSRHSGDVSTRQAVARLDIDRVGIRKPDPFHTFVFVIVVVKAAELALMLPFFAGW